MIALLSNPECHEPNWTKAAQCMKEINNELHTTRQITLQVCIAGCLICWLSKCAHGRAAQPSVTWRTDSKAVHSWLQSKASNSRGSGETAILILLTFLGLYGHGILNRSVKSAWGCIRLWQYYVKKKITYHIKTYRRTPNTKTDNNRGWRCAWNKPGIRKLTFTSTSTLPVFVPSDLDCYVPLIPLTPFSAQLPCWSIRNTLLLLFSFIIRLYQPNKALQTDIYLPPSSHTGQRMDGEVIREEDKLCTTSQQ